ncbi:DUF475 domain-containing protein [Pseudoduganella sp. SL102]|uniref:DUF475 domain-containing protein n=1 Tax=Pseudoduganella albidiflava TaxID=321983 RepID=A0A411X215_9BURK|nr:MULTISPECIES: DUF475 domain-containing protein [Pseudoduganella]QBI02925.1 DUF475 domain-containing protein [Pseudoduganella albidiflava]WBS04579.1 DUF475 domain-containing protein [Pseudoduganella sp. SL102]GGY57436.1 hypothetical protein GCM10007387_45060 [Pseudoduganella albidiflava]
MKHFRISIIVTVALMILAGWWGYSQRGMAGLFTALWITGVLGIMEVSLSFDNAVVNASVLKDWNAFWQKLFLTVGILIAVFGMRLVFPLAIVAVATGLDLVQVWTMATTEPAEYSRHLMSVHAEVAAFGGAFLLLVFLNFIFDEEKEVHWLDWIEKAAVKIGTGSLSVLLALLAILVCVELVEETHRFAVLYAGITGIAIYLGVSWLSGLLEEKEHEGEGNGDLAKVVQRGSIGGFLYLEVLDASFSFDGVIGAFAITSDVVIIMLGLAIGAMYVRSLTVYLVHKGTLDEFIYLEHGAHYAIGILAVIMLASVRYHVPEWFTGLSGVAFIVVSLYSSVKYRKQMRMQ